MSQSKTFAASDKGAYYLPDSPGNSSAKKHHGGSAGAVAVTSTTVVPYSTSTSRTGGEMTTAQTMTPAWEEGEDLGNQKEDMIIYGPLATRLKLPKVEQDLVTEVLALNTTAMERCREGHLANATEILEDALYKLNPNLNEDPFAIVLSDAQLVDQLSATTLSNFGVVESHRGQPKTAIRYFESARELENKWNIASPSVSVNMCAAYNSLKQYERASAAALETISMLRELEVQRQRELQLRRRIEARQMLNEKEAAIAAQEDAGVLEYAASQVRVSDIENAALWGAAWHNLGVAQVNTVRASQRKNNTNAKIDQSEITNALKIMQNAMKATQDLLGMDHPMTAAVTETYRAVRDTLRDGGAFKQHRTLMTAPLPPVDPCEREAQYRSTQPMHGTSRSRTVENQKKDLTITFRGEATNRQKFIDRLPDEAYPSSFKKYNKQVTANNAYGKHKGASDSGKKTKKGSSRANSKTRGSATLRGAEEIYRPNDTASKTKSGKKGSRAGSSSNKADRHLATTSAGDESEFDEKDVLFPTLNTTYQHTSESRPHGGRGKGQNNNITSPLYLSHNGTISNNSTPRPLQSSSSRKQSPSYQSASASRGDVSNRSNGDGAGKKNVSSKSEGTSTEGGTGVGNQANNFTESSRFLLLAQSPRDHNRTKSDEEGKTPTQHREDGENDVAAGASSNRKLKQNVDVDVQTNGPPVSGYVDDDDTGSGGSSARHGGGISTTSSSHPPRELFDAMWVSADDKYLSKGNRSFGTPAYFVPDIDALSKRASISTHTQGPYAEAGTPSKSGDGESGVGSTSPASGSRVGRSSVMVYDESDGNTVFIKPPPSPSAYREL